MSEPKETTESGGEAAAKSALAQLFELAQVCALERREIEPREENNKWTSEENTLLTQLAADGTLSW
jgi:hypothetical protein